MTAASTLMGLALAATACGGADTRSRDAAEPTGPTTLRPAGAASPPGTRRVVCALDVGGKRVRFALDLPDDVNAGRTSGRQCIWGHREQVRGYTTDYRVVITVSAAAAEDRTLQQMYDDNQPFLVDEGEFEGDDTVYDLELDDGVPVFGATLGQRFREHCFCDGQDPIYRAFEADGVRVSWVAHADLQQQTDREIDRALSGAGRA